LAFNDEIRSIVFCVTTLLHLIIVIQPSPEKFTAGNLNVRHFRSSHLILILILYLVSVEYSTPYRHYTICRFYLNTSERNNYVIIWFSIPTGTTVWYFTSLNVCSMGCRQRWTNRKRWICICISYKDSR